MRVRHSDLTFKGVIPPSAKIFALGNALLSRASRIAPKGRVALGLSLENAVDTKMPSKPSLAALATANPLWADVVSMSPPVALLRRKPSRFWGQ